MADFDLSMIATMDSSSAEQGARRVEDGIERISAAEYRGLQATQKSAQTQREAASAEKQREASLANVMRMIDPNYQAQLKLNKALDDAARFYREGAISAEQYARVQQMAAKATAGGAQSAGQARATYANLGFQIQDITQSLALGISPLTVFAQQAGQTAAAAAGMGGKLGAVASFIAGPWGSILLGAVTVVGFLTAALWENNEASAAAEAGADSLAKRQLDVANFFDVSTGAIKENSRALIENARVQIFQKTLDLQKAAAERKKAAAALITGSLDPRIAPNAGSSTRGDLSIPGSADIVTAINAAKGNNSQIATALSEIGRSNSVNAATARELSGLIAQGTLDSRELKGLENFDKSLSSGNLVSDLIKRKGSTRGRKTGGRSGNKEGEQLADFGQKAEERIKRLNEQFDETPKLVDKANQATRELDTIIADLAKRKPPGFENTIKTAEAAKLVVQEALVRPFNDLLKQSEQRMNVERLIAAGREDEAAALEIIYQLEERVGEVKEGQRKAIVDQVRKERELNEVLERRREMTNAYLDLTREVRGELESILSGRGGNILKTLKQGFLDIQGKILTEKLFGPALRELDEFTKGQNGVKTNVDFVSGKTDASGLANPDLPADGPPEGEGIVVAGMNLKRTVVGLDPKHYFERLTNSIAGPILQGLDQALGVKFFSGLQNVLSGVLYGLATGGTLGGILSGLKSLNETFGPDVLGSKLSKTLDGVFDKALGGAQTGTQVAAIGKALGIKTSSLGGQVGGAIGSFLPIPGGKIIGSIIGSVVGGAFKKTPYGTAVVGGGGDPTVRGNKSAARDVAAGLGGSVQDAIASIADALDADIGNFLVSIGTYKGKARVSTTGRSGKLKSKYSDVKDFGKGGEEEALAFAIATALGQGAITGISAAMQKALQSNKDVDKAVREALAVRDLEDLISGLSDLDKAFRDADKAAEERIRLAKAYGLDLVAVERINAEQRKKLVDEALEAQVGSLKDLLADLSYGALFEGSASQRRAQLLKEIGDAQADINAGVEGATDRYADLQRRLVDTSREAFGTAGPEYANDRAQAITNAERIIRSEEERIQRAAGAQVAQLEALTQNNTLTNETNDLLAGVNTQLFNIGTLLQNQPLGDITNGGLNNFRDTAVPF